MYKNCADKWYLLLINMINDKYNYNTQLNITKVQYLIFETCMSTGKLCIVYL